MKSATIQEAKERLEELIEAARRGETVEITEAGERVAQLVGESAQTDGAAASPVASHSENGAPEDVDWEARLAEMDAKGQVVRSKLSPSERRLLIKRFLVPFPPGAKHVGTVEALLEERRQSP
jgi:prevent-host-death family protein